MVKAPSARPLRLLGAGLYSAIHFGLACQKLKLPLVTPILKLLLAQIRHHYMDVG
jgi:hypothetical protein